MSRPTRVDIDLASLEDIRFFAREQQFPTMKAWAAREDDEPIALFGFARGADARWYAFFDITEKARRHKKRIVRMGKGLMDEARNMGFRFVYAIADEREPLAKRWLRSLGFEERGALMRWENEVSDKWSSSQV